MDLRGEHKDDLFEAAVAADLLVMVEIDTKDIKVMLSETTDPRHAAKILRDIAQALDDEAPELRQMPATRFER